MSTMRTRLFDHPLLEALSKAPPALPISIWGPVFFFVQVNLLRNEQIVWSDHVLFLILGVFQWMVLEYLLHRFVFHLKVTGGWLERFVYVVHGNHHLVPKDRLRGLMPPLATFVCAIPIGLFCHWAFPAAKDEAVFGGMLLGFLFYDYLHFSFHHFSWKNNLWRTLRRRHLTHHANPEIKFGVTSPLLDLVFHTNGKR